MADTVLFTPTLAEAFDRAGMPFPGEPEPGRLLRFSTNERDRTDRAGWLKLLPDAAGAAFGCWRAGLSYCWQRRDTNSPPPSPEERTQARQRAEEARQQAEQERAEAYALAAKEWVTGLQVHEVVPAASEQEMPVPERVTGTNYQHAARASRRRALEVLAAQPLQKYECNQNREILAARRELEMAGHSVSDPASTT